VDVNGNVAGYNDYYPYGMTMPARSMSSSADPRYQSRHPLEKIDVAEITPQAGFTGKERDAAETGYDYFGARYYDSWSARWLQVDPMANKYPGWSPYNYVADNPVIFVDPHGDTIDVSHLTAEQSIQYNKMIALMGQSKNFKKLYGDLQASKSTYVMTVGEPEDDRAAAQFKENEPGVVGSGGTFTFREGAMGSFGNIAHEFFHAGQNAIGPDIVGSTGREVEAFLFQWGVQLDLNERPPVVPQDGFGAAFLNIETNGFNDKDWRILINGFLSSPFNSSNIYTDRSKLEPTYYAKPLISNFNWW
jgi:RHS repeat-associated protein